MYPGVARQVVYLSKTTMERRALQTVNRRDRRGTSRPGGAFRPSRDQSMTNLMTLRLQATPPAYFR